MENKITLKTLARATEQEVFDQVAGHLLAQSEPSVNVDVKCMYRGPNGKMCAAGCLIADDEYSDKFEGITWIGLISHKLVPSSHEALIDKIQRIHDSVEPLTWKIRLHDLAKERGLEWKFN